MNQLAAGDDRRRQEWRRRQRQIARTHHPDTGSDPEHYMELMRELDQHFRIEQPGERSRPAWPAGANPGPVTLTSSTKTRFRRGLRASRQVARAIRARLPRGVPGSRRYIDL